MNDLIPLGTNKKSNLAKIETDLIKNGGIFFISKSKKIEILVNALRLVSQDKDMSNRSLFIPDNCGKYGYSEGSHNLGVMLHFLADMLEE